MFIAGAAVQWLRDGLGIIGSAAETEALAESVADAGGVYLVPAFVGLGAPYWDPYARGVLVGLTRGTTRAHIARAALEAIAYQTRDVLDAMAREAGAPLQALRVDGGAAAQRLSLQFQADVLGVEVLRPAGHRDDRARRRVPRRGGRRAVEDRRPRRAAGASSAASRRRRSPAAREAGYAGLAPRRRARPRLGGTVTISSADREPLDMNPLPADSRIHRAAPATETELLNHP